MKANDFQFIRNCLLLNDRTDLLNTNITVVFDGEENNLIRRKNEIIYSNPTSSTFFLFYCTYNILADFFDDLEKDKLGLTIYGLAKSYVENEFDDNFDEPPVILDYDKLLIPSLIMNEFVHPLTSLKKDVKVLMTKSNFVDTCSIVESNEELHKTYNIISKIRYKDFPLILCNTNIRNKPAFYCHLIVKLIEMSLGEIDTKKFIKNLLVEEEHLFNNLVMCLKLTQREPDFVLEFINMLEKHGELTQLEKEKSDSFKEKIILSDKYFKNVKTAFMQDPQVFKQWHQWSMLMGLIEKQLTPMRGSMWPATENLKKYEDHLKTKIKQEKEKKGRDIGMEELLEVSRDIYDKNAVEPGKLIEHFLKEKRIWKT